MPEQKFYKHEFFKKNNTQYTFKVESALKIGKIHIVAYKRDAQDKRIDMAEFYLNYQSFLAILNTLNSAFKAKKEYKIDLTGGDDGKRKLYINLKFSGGLSLGFKLIDNIIKEKDIKFKDYTGNVGFILKSVEDIIEFFGLEQTIRAWELANINKIVTHGFTVND